MKKEHLNSVRLLHKVALLVVLVAIVLAGVGCSSATKPVASHRSYVPVYFYDEVHNVSCYTIIQSISCLQALPNGSLPANWVEMK